MDIFNNVFLHTSAKRCRYLKTGIEHFGKICFFQFSNDHLFSVVLSTLQNTYLLDHRFGRQSSSAQSETSSSCSTSLCIVSRSSGSSAVVRRQTSQLWCHLEWSRLWQTLLHATWKTWGKGNFLVHCLISQQQKTSKNTNFIRMMMSARRKSWSTTTRQAFQPGRVAGPVSSEISDFTTCAHAQRNVLHFKYAEKTDDGGSGFR